MNRYFADTTFFIAILNRHDELHARARALNHRMGGILITTQWVFAELLDGFGASAGNRRGAADFVRAQSRQDNTIIIPASPDWFYRGLDLYRERPDKAWSLTDCISFLVMEDHGLREALTADHHFEQAGFIPLLK